MNSYQVTRAFSGQPTVGAILTDADFRSPERAKRLVDQRYIKPLVRDDVGMQPTTKTLLAATIRQLDKLLMQVADRCLVESALAQESRETAKKLMEKRLTEMGES